METQQESPDDMSCPEATWEVEAVGRQPCCLIGSDHSSELSQRSHQPGLLPASRAMREENTLGTLGILTLPSKTPLSQNRSLTFHS